MKSAFVEFVQKNAFPCTFHYAINCTQLNIPWHSYHDASSSISNHWQFYISSSKTPLFVHSHIKNCNGALAYLNRTFIDFQLCRIRYVCEGNVISSSIWNFVCSKSRYGGRNLTKKSAKMGPSERPKFARRSAWFLVTSPVVHSAPGAGCTVL